MSGTYQASSDLRKVHPLTFPIRLPSLSQRFRHQHRGWRRTDSSVSQVANTLELWVHPVSHRGLQRVGKGDLKRTSSVSSSLSLSLSLESPREPEDEHWIQQCSKSMSRVPDRLLQLFVLDVPAPAPAPAIAG